jgi:predicted ester cyclase
MDQLFTPDYNDHATGPGMVPGVEGFKQFYSTMLKAFPDLRVTVHDQIAEGDKVVTRKTFSGTLTVKNNSFQVINSFKI